MVKKEIGIGIIGLGNVGGGTLSILENNKSFIEQEISPKKIKIVGVSDLNIERNPGVDKTIFFTSNAEEIIEHPEVDILVETIGGEYPAYNFIKKALKEGKHVVTPNKEVIAKHGYELLKIAEQNNVQLLFESSVASAIPILGSIVNILTSCPLDEISGILNGTTNYILDLMLEQSMTQEEALKKAQKMGYAEADPSKDINGVDTLYKIFILASLAFRGRLNLSRINYSGISEVTLYDTELAKQLGYCIKLLATAKKRRDKVEIRVNPVLIEEAHPLSAIHGAGNGILLHSKDYGSLFFSGAGAGGIAAASMIVSDTIKIIREPHPKLFENRFLLEDANKLEVLPLKELQYPFFLNINLVGNEQDKELVKNVFLKRGLTIKKSAQIKHNDSSKSIGIITSPVKEGILKEFIEEFKILNSIKTINYFEVYQN